MKKEIGKPRIADFCENVESGLLVIARNFDTFPTEVFPGLPMINHGKKWEILRWKFR